MRVLVANKYWYRRGGADAHALDVDRLLRARGHETAVFSMTHPRNEPSRDASHFADRVRYRDAGLAERLTGAGRMLWNAQAARRLRALLAERPCDVAHMHNVYHQLSPSILPAAREAGLPVVLTVHDLKPVCPSYRMLAPDGPCERCRGGRYWNAALTRCYEGSFAKGAWLGLESALHAALGTWRRHVGLWICPSRFYRDTLARFGLPADRLRVLPYFLDPDGYRPGGPAGDHVLYFGRLSPEKGLDTLIRAVVDRPGVRLVVAGDGPERARLEAAAAPAGGRVRFVGYLAGDALHDTVRAARASVVPSEWYENCPVSIIESLALGRPVVAASIGGLPEMIAPGQTGWLFPPGDARALGDALETALAADRAGEVERCRAAFEARYAPGPFLERLLELYGEAREAA